MSWYPREEYIVYSCGVLGINSCARPRIANLGYAARFDAQDVPYKKPSRDDFLIWYPREESNLYHILRTDLLYPLSYRGKWPRCGQNTKLELNVRERLCIQTIRFYQTT